MKRQSKKQSTRILAAFGIFVAGNLAIAQTAPPPNMGDETKGTPAIEEGSTSAPSGSTPNSKEVATKSDSSAKSVEQKSSGPLGTATIKESRRENGQVYLIELKHSSGAKQYIEETDSDGDIESNANGIDDTPNLPKWKLGSW